MNNKFIETSNRRVAIMQPYFFPYIGYFQLIKAVDIFIIYDNIQFTKRGWINRNRIQVNGKESWMTLPVTDASRCEDIIDKSIAKESAKYVEKLKRQLFQEYHKSTHFEEVNEMLNDALFFESNNLFDVLYKTVDTVCKFLNIETECIKSSEVDLERRLRGEERVIDLCTKMKATKYLNLPGGVSLYDKSRFVSKGIELSFLVPNDNPPFSGLTHEEKKPWSIIDTLFRAGRLQTIEMLNHYTEI